MHRPAASAVAGSGRGSYGNRAVQELFTAIVLLYDKLERGSYGNCALNGMFNGSRAFVRGAREGQCMATVPLYEKPERSSYGNCSLI